MFVSSNSLHDLLEYFKRKLEGHFDKREIENIFYLICDYEYGLSRVLVKVEDKKLSESELLTIRGYVKRLEKGEPIQYILGETEFAGIRLKVDSSVLIPRPETEEFIALLIKKISGKGNLLDIGTGSGCIPIGVNKTYPDLICDAIDVSKQAIDKARENAALNKIEIEFLSKDIMSDDLLDLPNYDTIVSNPPYVLESDKKDMNANVLNFEPELALFVPNDDPLKFYIRIADLGRSKLNDGGQLFFEIHEDFGKEIKSMLEESGYSNVEIHQDMQGKDRMISAAH